MHCSNFSLPAPTIKEVTKDDPFGNKVQLFSETGYNLTIRSSGDVLGTQDDADEDSHIEIKSGGGVGLIRLLGTTSNLYACFGTDGEIYAESDGSNEGTIFEESFQGSYSAYKSTLYPEWYIGIKKNGKPKKGPRTNFGQKAVKFLPRRL